MSSSNLLHAIQFSNNDEIYQILSTQDIDVNSTTENGKEKKTVLYIAIERGNTNIISEILSNSAIDVNKKTILELPYEETNNYYGENANEPNTFGEFGGYHAPMYESEKETFCEEHNNTMVTTALYLAISKGEPMIVRMLLSHPNIDVNCLTIRKYCAFRNQNWEQTLSNTYWNTQKKAPLHLAIEKKNIEIVQLLLEHPQINLNLPVLYESGHNFLEVYSII